MTCIATTYFSLPIPPGELRTLSHFTIGNVQKMNFIPRPQHQGLWPSLAELRQEVQEEDIDTKPEAPPTPPAEEEEQPQPFYFTEFGHQLSNLAPGQPSCCEDRHTSLG